MNVAEALHKRKSVRAFTGEGVPQETIEHILDKARWAPSGTNTQPWDVVVTMGETKQKLCDAMETAFLSGEKGKMDYLYYPLNWHEPYQSRRIACGQALYQALGVERGDKTGRNAQWAKNYRAFDAPVVMYFFIDPIMEPGSYFDYGMFYQSVMLMAVEEGLATCPQAALGEYPHIVKEMLNVPQEKVLLCGLAMGYEATEAAVNNYRTEREAVDAFTRFMT